jgi:hypothetical protein
LFNRSSGLVDQIFFQPAGQLKVEVGRRLMSAATRDRCQAVTAAMLDRLLHR